MSVFPEGYRLGPYRIVRLVGEGGMGAVYEARQETLDRRVALKTLRPDSASSKEAVARFFNEAKVLSRLEHPCIVQVSDFGKTEDGILYLVMEFLRGEPLARRLFKLAEQNLRLPVTTALQIAWQVADALSVAHTQGIVHRDLKPDNLMLVSDPIAPSGERVKILDFGIVKLTKSDERSVVKTDINSVIGTPMYMSPEQCAGAGGVDAKTDVYSLGCVLYEALAGQPPFQGEGFLQLLSKHMFQTPPALSSLAPKLPSQISALVHRMLEKERKQRLSMSDAADELGRLLTKMPGGGTLMRSPPPVNTDPDATKWFGPLALSTTLGYLTGQRMGASPKLLRRLTIGGAVLALGLGTVFLLRARSPAANLPVSRPQAAPASPAAKTALRWHIETDPTNAAVLDEEGRMLGVTPWTQSAVAAPGKRSLRLHLDGYSDIYISMDGNADFDQKFPLTPSETAPPAKHTGSRHASSTKEPKPSGTKAKARSKGSKIGYEE